MPHAGLGYHFLRVHVRTTGSWRSSRGKSQTRKSKTKRQGDDVARKSAELNSAKLNFKQVQVDDQSTPPSSYHSFVAYGGYDEPHAPAEVNGNNSTESL